MIGKNVSSTSWHLISKFYEIRISASTNKIYWNIVLLICFVLSIATFMVFPTVLYPCENWTLKKAEHQRTDAFELWCWRRLPEVPWTARRSNQTILREINPECSLEGLMLNLKLQYLVIWCEQMTHWKSPWCWERLRAEGEEGIRGWDS